MSDVMYFFKLELYRCEEAKDGEDIKRSTLCGSTIPIPFVLEAMTDRESTEKFEDILRDMYKEVKGGFPLWFKQIAEKTKFEKVKKSDG